MADWHTIPFKFNVFDLLKPPLEVALTALELVEAILEALLALLKPFFLDLLNPLNAIVQTIIAALNIIINQIESTGLNLLLIHPDTSQPDISAVFNSISGGYTAFENKVVQKFFDPSDIFRPQYPPGSSVAMLILYLGAESPGDIIELITSLLGLMNTGIDVTLPAPVDLKVLPSSQSGQIATQFRSLWARLPGTDPLDALTLEWRMPQAPQGMDIGGAINQAVSLYNTTRLPNFIVERVGPFPTKGDEIINPQGEPALLEINSATLGEKVKANTDRYNFPAVRNKVYLKDIDGSIFRIFPVKYDVAGGNLSEGLLTGSYEFTDDDDLEPGSTYYYRVRAYFGDPTGYLWITNTTQSLLKSFSKKNDANEAMINVPGLSLGKPSRVVAGFVPREGVGESAGTYDPYYDVLDAVRVGLLLNFEFPRVYPEDSGLEDTNFRLFQKTGWGTLAGLAGAVGPLKHTFPISKDLQDNILFTAKARRLVNMALSNIAERPQLAAIIEQKWNNGVGAIISRFYQRNSAEAIVVETTDDLSTAFSVSLSTTVGTNNPVPSKPDGLNKTWYLPGIVGGMTHNNAQAIDRYLSFEDGYNPGDETFNGPVPISPDYGNPYVTAQERQDLADFITLAIGGLGPITSYLAWQATTVGDLLPALLPFLFDFEQFLLALLNAVNSIIKAIQEIVETLLQKIRALKQIIQSILDIIELLSIEVSLSVLYTSGSGDASTLVSELVESKNKPGDSPHGLHSGIVMTAGGPGPAFVAAVEALVFIFGLD